MSSSSATPERAPKRLKPSTSSTCTLCAPDGWRSELPVGLLVPGAADRKEAAAWAPHGDAHGRLFGVAVVYAMVLPMIGLQARVRP